MGLEFNLEINELAICLECDMMINDGETGCVQKFEEIKTAILAMGDEELLEALERVYQTQHHEYFELTDEEIIQNIAYCLQKVEYIEDEVILSEEVLQEFLDTVFFYTRNIITSVTIGMYEGLDVASQEKLTEQWMHDICTSYFEYKEALLKLIAEGER